MGQVTGSIVTTLDAVRCIHPDPRHSRVFTSSGKGGVSIWDLRNRNVPVRRYLLPHKEETVTLSYQPKLNVLAVGSRELLNFFDPRCAKPEVLCVNNLQQGWGTRSLSWNGNILTSTGGYGRVVYFDIRASNYVEVEERNFFQASNGWVREDSAYTTIFHVLGLSTPTCIYTHSYNPS